MKVKRGFTVVREEDVDEELQRLVDDAIEYSPRAEDVEKAVGANFRRAADLLVWLLRQGRVTFVEADCLGARAMMSRPEVVRKTVRFLLDLRAVNATYDEYEGVDVYDIDLSRKAIPV